ncbi:MAG: alpha/beta hydrolase [Acidobacteriota bacterium]|nr:alpha/beta hydrolase [Acidobacteriota bacterium]
MKHFISFAILLIAFGWATFPIIAQNNQPNDIREAARKVMMPVVYKVAGIDKVKVVENLKYTATSDPNILMDLYLPPSLSKTEKRPVVIFIHGGAKPEYTPKDWGIYTSWGRIIAASGLVGVTFTHRLEYPNKSLENAAQDVTDAIKYVRANADKYNIDKDRICLISFSAGGPMLTLPMRGEMPYVKCVVGFYAFMDVRQSDYQKNESAETLKTFSAITYLEKDAGKLPPMFIARAGRDEVPTINDSIDRFTKEAIAKNITLNFANHPNGIHGFDNQNNDERSREIIREAIEFIKIHLTENHAKGK